MSSRKYISAIIILIFAAFMLISTAGLDFGNPKNTQMDSYMIENGQALAAVNNIVSGVVFDFRGFDTLGEATVLFTAVLGVSLMFRKRKEEDEDYEYE
ncbi:MAG: hypothetical protein PHV39_03630 [Methanomicrobium sp.]|nr:hypothetical protein [Methanomicrobium sp.]